MYLSIDTTKVILFIFAHCVILLETFSRVQTRMSGASFTVIHCLAPAPWSLSITTNTAVFCLLIVERGNEVFLIVESLFCIWCRRTTTTACRSSCSLFTNQVKYDSFAIVNMIHSIVRVCLVENNKTVYNRNFQQPVKCLLPPFQRFSTVKPCCL